MKGIPVWLKWLPLGILIISLINVYFFCEITYFSRWHLRFTSIGFPWDRPIEEQKTWCMNYAEEVMWDWLISYVVIQLCCKIGRKIFKIGLG